MSAVRTGNNIRLDWAVSGGHTYIVQISTNSTGGVGAAFTDLSPLIPIPGSGEGVTNYVDVNAATNKGRYYRIRLN